MAFLAASVDQWQRRRGAAVLVGIVLVLGLLGGRLIQINTTLRRGLTAIAARQQKGISTLPARRGMIFDARGRVVALSRQVSDVFVDPSLVEDVGALAAEVAARTNVPVADIIKKIEGKRGSRFVVIASGVDEICAEAIRAMRHRAVGLTNRAVRDYPLGRSMAHALGWVGRDGHGLEGVELAYDGHMSGEAGRRATIRDVRRRAMRQLGSSTVPPADGGHVVLTLDAEIQRITEDALADGAGAYEAQSGVAVVLSPNDGDVLAMACWPTFDPGEPATKESLAIRRNRLLTDPVEPGSTFKPIVGCGALDGAFISPSEKIDCHQGVHYFGSRRVKDTKPNGLMDLKGIIARSSNIGMALIGQRMGNEGLHETIRRFGFGERTGVGGRAESAGVVYPLRRWDSYSTVSIPFGYEVLVTPLQLARAFAAIVNDGILVKPRLVKALLSADGEVVESIAGGEVVRRVTSSASAAYMSKEVLVAVVEEGGGRRAKAGPYRVLGKTGTAKLVDGACGVYEPDAYLSLFVGAAPVSTPRLVVLVMIRRPNASKGYYGGTVSAPVVGRIVAESLAYLEVIPDDPPAMAGL